MYENFVCFDLSKQTRRSTLSCKVLILFPLKIYPFTGYKQKVRFCTRNSRILTFILKRMRRDYLRRCKCDLCLNSDILSFGVSDLTIQFYLWHTRSLYVLEFKMRKCKMRKVNLRYYIDCAGNVNYAIYMDLTTYTFI